MKPAIFGLVLALTFSGAAMAAPNTLTPKEKTAGWRLLFDGRTLAGWRGFKAPAPDPGWRVVDGALGPDPKTSRDVISKDRFGDFELSFQWKISKLGNSGVMYHVIEAGDETYESGPEYQILDNAHGEEPRQQAASLFALYAPARDMTKPPGEWNQGRIVVRRNHVEHWLNGAKVVEYDLGSPDFKARVAASKFAQWPQFASAASGHIALQNHGDEVWFRDLKIRPLK
ncbi:DUF1080 domain-containing protein [Phenylobacterium sp.]|uniref:3-keto-disaccharide hydrolase n=1 Tax=Phenylobacterium sp. TaxID=1871053 RepID=UPI00260DD91D|nr:DUF1080 domain-containing protein [Phenylobacterium sp.]